MKISDEMLTGFLDAELAEEGMEQVRQAIETDDELVMRIADLSEVDQWVVDHARQIDSVKVPQNLIDLARQLDLELAQKDKTSENNVVQISTWKRLKSEIKLPYSLAAGVAIVIGVGFLSLNKNTFDAGISAEIAAILDTSLSGDTKRLEDDQMIRAQLSFANQQGHLCRQYQLVADQQVSTNIACRNQQGWQLEANLTESGAANFNQYQTAASQQKLDAVIDKMISGSPLNRNQEQLAISNKWQVNNK